MQYVDTLLMHTPSSFPIGFSDTEPEESFLQRDRLALPGPWPGRLLWRTINPPIPYIKYTCNN